MTTITVSYVAQYIPRGAGDQECWADLAKRNSPEEASERIAKNEADWDHSPHLSGRPLRYRVIRRQVVEDVVSYPPGAYVPEVEVEVERADAGVPDEAGGPAAAGPQ